MMVKVKYNSYNIKYNYNIYIYFILHIHKFINFHDPVVFLLTKNNLFSPLSISFKNVFRLIRISYNN